MSQMIEGSSSSDEGNNFVIAINRSFSDGTESSWPTEETCNKPVGDKRARVKLAKLWMQKTGEYQRGVNYILDRLPDGYALFDRPRQANPEIRDRLIFGHPVNLVYNSTKQFFPHFYYLMTGGEEPCAYNEGTPDVFKHAVLQLKLHGLLELDITEPSSMDWRAERSALDEHIQKLDMQPSFLPRAGEVVLWTPDCEGELAWNPEHSCVQIYSTGEKRWLGTPEWRAGIISQVPEEETVFQDIVATSPKEMSINYSGFRVETFPDPHSPDKSYSLHYKYVYLKSIKPFGAFEHFLQNIPRERLHPSIEYAMTIMSSFSLLDKYYFKGAWPDASIYCRGIFIGAELLVVGDAVRLKPTGYNTQTHETRDVTDVMVIEEIRLDLKQCDDELKSKHLAEKYQVRIRGKVYTASHRRVYLANNNPQPTKPLTPDEVVDAFHIVGMNGYGDWYHVHSGAMVDVSQDMILGRLYEPDALKLMFGSLSFGYDLHGVVSGREYSRQADERISTGRTWFWGDFRTQTLAIDSLNGEDVGHYSDARNIKMWQANLRLLDGIARPADIREAKIPGDIGRPSAQSRSNFAKVGKLSKLVSTGLGATDMSNPVSSAEEGTGRLSIGEDDEETEEEDFTLHIEQLRGGTEETEEGDYVPDREPQSKRARHDS
ncbi:hypothetical protein ASPCADRAFT_505649 [Aspergillus carbonarius ITEM 5010]|uniref:Cryptic loci regulator 2 C-terminal domain-containing protein n=1 Tax=Aspergillus carbonarius (strain ITEM 5010) TaxID=602072 RepID=A0A1R3RS07_ASPC5|nr:hypothetical protein ASPCADRAFT_505649 [Aspergillus carbonarius ITEM 5010]